jgi:RHS repeat-associated protein
MRQEGNLVKQPYGFTGREWDSETGLYFYRARYYDPQMGRFISKDPIGFAGGDVVLYGYVQNDPVNFIDPWGHEPWYNDSNHWTAWTFDPANASLLPFPASQSAANSGLAWYNDPTHWSAYKFYPGNPVGPFGPICGPEGSIFATWLPDFTPGACRSHDDCYEDCASNCQGNDCKIRCDMELYDSNPPYGLGVLLGGKTTYNNLKDRYGCNECSQ